MGYALKNEQTFEETSCCSCGIVFYVPATWDRYKRDKHENFFCPNGHSLRYHGKSEAENLREALAAAERTAQWERDRAATADRARKQAEGKLKGLKKRVASGVCPCCQRTVGQLARHMKTKHPEFVEREAAS